MKFVNVLLLSLALILLAVVNSSKANESQLEWNQLQDELPKDFGITNPEAVELNRQKRLTCDIDRALCIAHCVLKAAPPIDVGKQLDQIMKSLQESLTEEVPQERSQLSRKKRCCSCGGCWIKGFRNNCCTGEGPYKCNC
ncbi:hypothetical protein DOY81_000667 [Sarcophaga bullata]|nr:hypothetical protein DOY81_000667 [Sarcophaga bullata]